MDSFTQILLRMPTLANAPSTSSHFRDSNPFKVQVKFNIPLFQFQIDVDVVDKWLNVLEGYLSFHNLSDRENITFALLKAFPHVKNWWDTYCEQNTSEDSGMFKANPTWASFIDVIKR